MRTSHVSLARTHRSLCDGFALLRRGVNAWFFSFSMAPIALLAACDSKESAQAPPAVSSPDVAPIAASAPAAVAPAAEVVVGASGVTGATAASGASGPSGASGGVAAATPGSAVVQEKSAATKAPTKKKSATGSVSVSPAPAQDAPASPAAPAAAPPAEASPKKAQAVEDPFRRDKQEDMLEQVMDSGKQKATDKLKKPATP